MGSGDLVEIDVRLVGVFCMDGVVADWLGVAHNDGELKIG